MASESCGIRMVAIGSLRIGWFRAVHRFRRCDSDPAREIEGAERDGDPAVHPLVRWGAEDDYPGTAGTQA